MEKKRLVLFFVVLFALTFAGVASADRYIMHVFDNTGSMDTPHGDDCSVKTDGECTRLDVAQDLAEANMGSPLPGVQEHHAVYLVQGTDSGLVTSIGVNGWTNDPADDEDDNTAWTEARDYIRSLEESADSVMTPLADSLCYAMQELAEQWVDEDTNLRMHLYTDGNENVSTDTICDGTDMNIYDFTANAVEAANADGSVAVIPDKPERGWAPADDTYIVWADPEQTKSLSYIDQNDGEIEKEWAGGVQPFSWEHRMYYRMTWGTQWDENAGNWTYNAPSNAEYKEDVRTIANIYSLYEIEIEEPVTYAKATVLESSKEIAALTQKDGQGLYPVHIGRDGALKNASSPAELTAAYAKGVEPAVLAQPSVVYSTLKSTEDSMFAGLSWLTNGRYVRSPDNETIPRLGDMDKDGDIDESDMRFVLSWFGRDVEEFSQDSIDSDLVNDGFINNEDINVVRNNWTDNNKYPPIIGDTDYNWCVDNSDLGKIWQWWGKTPGPADQAFYHADLNADGAVNWADFNIMMSHWNEGCGTNGIPTCDDGIKYGEETDIDCGGSICGGCSDSEACLVDEDCLSNVCEDYFCVGGGTPAINLGSVNSETPFDVDGSQALLIDQLSLGWTPSKIVVGFGHNDSWGLNGVTVSVEGGSPVNLYGDWQVVEIPFTNQSSINLTVDASFPRSLRAQWWAQ